MKFTLTILAGFVSVAAFAQNSFETKPDIHGDTVVFTAEGDLWLASASSHAARRITSDPGTEQNARFSPDGKWIAFTGEYDAGTDVYVMPVDGGSPRRLTYDPFGALVQGWTADGSGVIFRSRRYSPVGGVRHLFVAPLGGGQAKQLPIPRADFGVQGRDGLVAYVPVSFEWANWFHYRGGSADDIWLADTKAATFRKLTDNPSVDTTPAWCGGKIYFVSERSGWSNLWEVDPHSKAVRQCTFFTDAPVRYPSADDHRVVFQHGAGLAVYDPASNKATELSFALDTDRVHAREQRIDLASQIGPGTVFAYGSNIAQLGNGIALGPTGKRILLEARGQIVSVASEAGDLRVLEKKPGTRARFPIWSPDGKRFAFLSDRSGENEIWIGNAAGGEQPTQLTHGLMANPFPFIWSPDGNWIAVNDRTAREILVNAKTGEMKVLDQADRLSAYDNLSGTSAFSPDSKYLAFSRLESDWLSSINLYEIASGRKERVTDPRVNSYYPCFDTTGKFLMYLADNSFHSKESAATGKYYFENFTQVQMLALNNDVKSPFLPKDDEEGVVADQKQQADKKAQQTPEGTKVDWEGLAARQVLVPLPPGRYGVVDSVPGKILVLNQGDTAAQNDVIAYDLNGRKATTLISGVEQFQKSLDNKKIMFISGRSMSVHDLDAGPTTMTQGAVNLAPYTITYDPIPEWREVFNESWRIARDFFYDPNMHGLDWAGIKRKYEARLELVGDRSDLTRVLSDMVSELNTGHAYIVDPTPAVRSQNMGFLGIDADPVPGSDAIRIRKLYRGDPWSPGLHSPFVDAGIGVKEGDYILEIAGQPVKANQDYQALLLGTRGQTVAVMVNSSPSRTGAKVVRVRPLASETELRYQDWVTGRTRYVEEHGGPNFGYAHIQNMQASGLTGFVKGQFPDIYKTAMIYDTRYNGGGHTSSLLLQDIAAYPTAWFKPRHGAPWTREGWAVIGHKVALCNEYNFSDGELFIEAWKKMGLGPVVGTRTGGGEVGSGGGYALIDGGSIYVPNYGAYADGSWIIEGKGASPTVEVEQDPNAVMAGRDPQLDRAIEILKQELAKQPVTIPNHPPFPIKTVPSTPH
jgi:tricorn protease